MPESTLALPNNRLQDTLLIVKRSLGDEWTFPAIDEWECFESLDDALPLLATLVGSGRYLWWVSGDVAEALMRKFGRTDAVKGALGAVFGCKARTVEYRARAALMFSPEMRHPDVPIELYREALMWGEQEAVPTLEAALDGDRSWYELRLERYERDGRDAAEPIFTNVHAQLAWDTWDGETAYAITFTEKGGPRFVRKVFEVVITVAPITRKENEDVETE